KWMLVKGLPPKMYNNLLADGEEGVILNFSDENDTKRIIVKFDGNVLSYRNTDEGSLMKMLTFLDENYGSSFYGNWSIFKAADRKSTRLNSSHVSISYAVFCLKKKTTCCKMRLHSNTALVNPDQPV